MTDLTRRAVLAAAGTMAALATVGRAAMSTDDAMMPIEGEDGPFTFGMLAFDGMTNLDFVGPFDFLSRVSGENLFDLFMTPYLSRVGASTNPGAVQPA